MSTTPLTVTNSNGSKSTYNLPATSMVGSVVESYNSASGNSSYSSSSGAPLANNSSQVQNYVSNQNNSANGYNYTNPATGNQVLGSNGVNTNNTVNGIPVTNQDFTINPNNKFADVAVSNNISGAMMTDASANADKAQAIVNKSQAQINAKANVATALSNYAQLNSQANSAFIQGAVMAATGKAASASQLGQTKAKGYNPTEDLSKMTVSQIADKFGLPYQKSQIQLPGATADPNSQVPADPSISDGQGLIDLKKFQSTFLADWQTITDKVNQDEKDLADYQAGTQEAMQNVGQQVGTEQGLLTGEAAAIQQQRALKENTLTRLLGIDQSAKADLTAKGQLQMSFMTAANQLAETAYQHARDLRTDQQTALASILSLGGMDTSKMSAATVNSLNNMSKATGIPMEVITNGLAAKYAKSLLDGQTQDTVTIGKSQYRVVYDDQGNIIKKTLIGTAPATGGSSDTLTPEEKSFQSDLTSALQSLSSNAGGNNKGAGNWGEIWNYMESRYHTPPDVLDQLLNKEMFYPKQ